MKIRMIDMLKNSLPDIPPLQVPGSVNPTGATGGNYCSEIKAPVVNLSGQLFVCNTGLSIAEIVASAGKVNAQAADGLSQTSSFPGACRHTLVRTAKQIIRQQANATSE